MKPEKITKVEKGWGHELIFANEDNYCGKILHFTTGEATSMHFHAIKEETFYILTGEYEITILNTTNADKIIKHLIAGEVLKITRLEPHQIKAIIGGDIIEVSTHDDPLDSYRVAQGSSQKKIENVFKFVHVSSTPIIEGDIDTPK